MAKKGYKSITVNNEVYDKLYAIAKTNHRSTSNQIEHLVQESLKETTP
jgi:hypothetical protein